MINVNSYGKIFTNKIEDCVMWVQRQRNLVRREAFYFKVPYFIRDWLGGTVWGVWNWELGTWNLSERSGGSDLSGNCQAGCFDPDKQAVADSQIRH